MTYDELWRPLATIYDESEARAIVRYVLDVRFGLSAADVYSGKVTKLSADDCSRLDEIMRRLMRAEPVQYVLGEAFFCGRAFAVEPGVLIPRPETEDLCQWVEEGIATLHTGSPAVLDIGTGSGCIAVTIALDAANARVEAWDVAATPLRVAERNAMRLKARVNFRREDVFSPPADAENRDVVVSNPPYVCLSERADMERNVLCHEPAEALFVPDDDPLRFYKAIATYAAKALRHGGLLYFEINPRFADDMRTLLGTNGYTEIETRRDRFGKVRFTKATKP